MKYPLHSYLRVLWVPVFLSLVLTSGYIFITLPVPMLSVVAPFIFVLSCISMIYFFILTPETVLLAGMLHLRTPPELELQIHTVIRNHAPSIATTPVSIHCMEDTGAGFWYFSTPYRYHLVISSALLPVLNQIDIENIIVYLLSLHDRTHPLRDTFVITLATVLEKTVILQPIASILVHMIRLTGFDLAVDKASVTMLQYRQGYLNTLIKMQAVSRKESRFMPCVSMNAYVDVTPSQRFLHTFSHVHESVENRTSTIG